MSETSVPNDALDFTPTLELLSRIAPVDYLNILTQDRDDATVHAVIFEENPQWYESDDGAKKTKEVVMKLEKSMGSRLSMVYTLHRLVENIVPPLIPKAMATGTVDLPDDTRLNFYISEFISSAVTLEDVWQEWKDEEQNSLMQLIAEAVVDLGQVSFEKSKMVENIRERLIGSEYLPVPDKTLEPSPNLSESTTEAPESTEAFEKRSIAREQLRIGGPSLGYFDDVEGFLRGFASFHNQKATSVIVPSERHGGIHIASKCRDPKERHMHSVHLSESDLMWLYDHACFQHNDLEPRNILVRWLPGHGDKHEVELASIIDWEMAGFYPPGFEYAIKDGYLGANNQFFSWYRLFKDRVGEAMNLREAPEPQIKFMKAIALIMESDLKEMGRSPGKWVRQKFLEREQVVQAEESWRGWVRKAGVGQVKKYSRQDNNSLEEEVLKELGILS